MPRPRPFETRPSDATPIKRSATPDGGEPSHLPEGQAPKTGGDHTSPTPRPQPQPEPAPAPTPEARPTPAARPIITKPAYPLLWEGKHAEAAQWTTYTTDLIDKDLADKLLPGAKDVLDFCPRYLVLSRPEKVNFWAFLISAVVEKESTFNPTNRSGEAFSQPDRVTGLPVFSEGLMQISYGDMLNYPNYCSFDWTFDRNLHENSPYKTIFDYERNLRCGIGILANQVARHRVIALKVLPDSKGYAYFKVLWPATRKLSQIQDKTKSLPFCSL